MLCLIFCLFESFVGASHNKAFTLVVKWLLRLPLCLWLCLVEVKQHGVVLAILGLMRNYPLMFSIWGETCHIYISLDAQDDLSSHWVSFLCRSICRFELRLVYLWILLHRHTIPLLLTFFQALLLAFSVVRGQIQGFDFIKRIIKLAVGDRHNFLSLDVSIICLFFIRWFCCCYRCYFHDFVMFGQFTNSCFVPRLRAILLIRLYCLLPR